jgi:ADP-heptose:LPS heptosyltransferase
MLLHGATNRGAVDMLDVDVIPQVTDFRRPDRVVRLLRTLRPEIVIDLTPWPRLTALVAMTSGALTVGYDSDGQSRGAAFDFPIRHRSDRHELENAKALAALFDPTGLYNPAIKKPTESIYPILPYDKLVIFHTTCGGSRRIEKAWSDEKWAELAHRLSKLGYTIGFSGAATEIPEIQTRQLKAAVNAETILLAGILDLDQFAYAIKASRALISLDTGAVHIASSLNAPVVGIYGPTRAERWGPWSERGIGVNSPHIGAGYISFGFETSGYSQAIMDAVTVETVFDAFCKIVQPLKP